MNRNLLLSLICITLIAGITILSALPFGFSKTEQTVQSVSADSIVPVREETGGQFGNTPGPVVHTMTFTNTFMPRQYVLPSAYACLYNSQTKQSAYANAHWQISSFESKVSDFSSDNPVVQLGREVRTVELTVDQMTRWKRPPERYEPMASVPMPQPMVDYPEGFDTLYLFLLDRDMQNFYPDCGNLQPSDLQYAKKILVI